MKLNELRPPKGSTKRRKRVARGIGSGKGKTATRGTKGQKARRQIKPWFEGGQTPIHIRVPKLHGFKNKFRVQYAVVNVGQISAYAEAGRLGIAKPPTVNAESLAQAGLIRGDDKPLKVLGQGEVSLKLFVAADAFSASAKTKIEAAGGNILVLAPEKPAAEEKAPKEKKARPAKAEAADTAAAGESDGKAESEAPEAESSESAESDN